MLFCLHCAADLLVNVALNDAPWWSVIGGPGGIGTGQAQVSFCCQPVGGMWPTLIWLFNCGIDWLLSVSPTVVGDFP